MTDNDVQFVELPEDGRMKYPKLLNAIRRQSIGPNSGQWAHLTDFDKVASARDTARRLAGEYPAYEFTSRSKGDGTGGIVYARYVGEPLVEDDDE